MCAETPGCRHLLVVCVLPEAPGSQMSGSWPDLAGFSILLSETGDLYVWGWNEAGQLALPAKGKAQCSAASGGEAAGRGWPFSSQGQHCSLPLCASQAFS